MSRLDLHKGCIMHGMKLLNRLGSGASGEVWVALTPDSNLVALKIYHGEESAKAKAEHEFCMASLFKNEHILCPLNISSFNSHPIIQLPYCEGRSVDGIAAHFSVKMIWKLIAHISHALMELHGQGYAHLDIKPSNILWDGTKFILTDFGSCLSVSSNAPEDTAVDGSSYQFDAPELTTQDGTACDIWSLGATIFYLFMGCHVFNGLGGRAQHAESPLPYIRKSLPILSELVQKCLNMESAKRPTAKEVHDIALTELSRIKNTVPTRKIRVPQHNKLAEVTEFWPEEMKDY